MTTILRTALPGAPIDSVGWRPDVHDLRGMRRPDTENLLGQQQASFEPGSVDKEAFDAARERLAGSQWQITDNGVHGASMFFVARRGGVVLEWEFAPAGVYHASSVVEVWAWRVTPYSVKVPTVTGWLLGGVLGWWLVRQAMRLGPGRGRVMALGSVSVCGAIFLLSTVVAIWLTVVDLVGWPVSDGPGIPVWLAYYPFLLPLGLFN